jgi:hypothetical protein
MNDKKEDLREYYTWGLTLLQLMSLLAVTGVVLNVVVSYLLNS